MPGHDLQKVKDMLEVGLVDPADALESQQEAVAVPDTPKYVFRQDGAVEELEYL